jgi:hypothetical protein
MNRRLFLVITSPRVPPFPSLSNEGLDRRLPVLDRIVEGGLRKGNAVVDLVHAPDRTASSLAVRRIEKDGNLSYRFDLRIGGDHGFRLFGDLTSQGQIRSSEPGSIVIHVANFDWILTLDEAGQPVRVDLHWMAPFATPAKAGWVSVALDTRVREVTAGTRKPPLAS